MEDLRQRYCTGYQSQDCLTEGLLILVQHRYTALKSLQHYLFSGKCYKPVPKVQKPRCTYLLPQCPASLPKAEVRNSPSKSPRAFAWSEITTSAPKSVQINFWLVKGTHLARRNTPYVKPPVKSLRQAGMQSNLYPGKS